MADVKLTPRQTAAILTKLDEGVRNVTEARNAVIEAMADRRTRRPVRTGKASSARRPQKT